LCYSYSKDKNKSSKKSLRKLWSTIKRKRKGKGTHSMQISLHPSKTLRKAPGRIKTMKIAKIKNQDSRRRNLRSITTKRTKLMEKSKIKARKCNNKFPRKNISRERRKSSRS